MEIMNINDIAKEVRKRINNAIVENRGARLEYEVAKACGLEIVVLDDDISLVNNYANNSGIKYKKD